MQVIIFAGIAIIGALLQLFLSKKQRSLLRVFKIFLLWFLAANGLMAILSFLAHVFFGPQTASLIGWPPNNPFQFEVGIANLGVGLLGVLCIWREDDFWLATIIMMTVFGWGAAVGHIIQIVNFKNFAPGNAGAVLYADIITPLILIGLYAGYEIILRKQEIEAINEGIRAA
jgi:hypothetical protein